MNHEADCETHYPERRSASTTGGLAHWLRQALIGLVLGTQCEGRAG